MNTVGGEGCLFLGVVMVSRFGELLRFSSGAGTGCACENSNTVMAEIQTALL